MRAIESSSSHVVQLLIDNGAKLRVRNRKGCTNYLQLIYCVCVGDADNCVVTNTEVCTRFSCLETRVIELKLWHYDSIRS